MGIINAYFPIDRFRNFLQTHKLYGLQYLRASLFGTVTLFFILSGWLFNAVL